MDPAANYDELGRGEPEGAAAELDINTDLAHDKQIAIDMSGEEGGSSQIKFYKNEDKSEADYIDDPSAKPPPLSAMQ